VDHSVPAKPRLLVQRRSSAKVIRRAPVHSLGTGLAVALQGVPDNRGDFLREPNSAGDDSKQLLAREALEQFVV
jgi:hypothetical protein